MFNYLMLSIVVILTTLGQLCLKAGLNQSLLHSIAIEQSATQRILSSAYMLIKNKYLLVGGLSFAIAPFFYYIALKTLPLHLAFAVVGLNFVCVFIGATLILGEKASRVQWCGVALVTLGVWIFHY